jgi:hypothetical protein
MALIDTMDLIDADGEIWGSQRLYPTREAFAEAAGADATQVTECYVRRCAVPSHAEWDVAWKRCAGPARGATKVWSW